MSAHPPTETWRPPTLPHTAALAVPGVAITTRDAPAARAPNNAVCRILDFIRNVLAFLIAAAVPALPIVISTATPAGPTGMQFATAGVYRGVADVAASKINRRRIATLNLKWET